MLRCDLHIHSKYSYDSLSSPKSIVKVARKRGLDEDRKVLSEVRTPSYLKRKSYLIRILKLKEYYKISHYLRSI